MQTSDQIPGEVPAAAAALMAEIVAPLRKGEGTDLGLLDILEKRILQMNAGSNAVAEALRDIEQLAAARAASAGQ